MTANRDAQMTISDAERRPFGNMRFRIEIEGLPETGAFEVIFPEAHLSVGPRQSRAVQYGTLTLRRGVTRSHEWYEWWGLAGRSKTPQRRTVSVVLIDERGADANRWTFKDAEPRSYLLSSLNALGNEPLLETLELTVASFEASFGSPAARRKQS